MEQGDSPQGGACGVLGTLLCLSDPWAVVRWGRWGVVSLGRMALGEVASPFGPPGGTAVGTPSLAFQ